MARVIQVSIDCLADELLKYADSLKDKNERFIAELLDKGIKVARDKTIDVDGTFGSHKMGHYVTFEMECNSKGSSVEGILIGVGQNIITQWMSPDNSEPRVGIINALHVLEFGTAAKALEPQTAFGVMGGQGTNSFYGHEDDLVWYFNTGEKDEKGRTKWKKATAITPTQPMYYAATEMLQAIEDVAKNIFGR